jgi:hypothetical protein
MDKGKLSDRVNMLVLMGMSITDAILKTNEEQESIKQFHLMTERPIKNTYPIAEDGTIGLGQDGLSYPVESII